MFGIEVIRRKENNEVHLYMSVKVVFNDAFYSYLVGVFECCDGEHEVAGGKVGALAPGTQDNQTVGHSLELE